MHEYDVDCTVAWPEFAEQGDVSLCPHGGMFKVNFGALSCNLGHSGGTVYGLWTPHTFGFYLVWEQLMEKTKDSKKPYYLFAILQAYFAQV